MLDGWNNELEGKHAVEFPLTGRTTAKGSEVDVCGVIFGSGRPVVIAGPCSVESRDQVESTAVAVANSGASMLRGGAFKPRTSPYSFQGLGEEGLSLLRDAGHRQGLPIVTEVLSEDHVGVTCEYSDMLQIGARNMQNFALLKKLSKCGKPLLLKRGPAATAKEWLLAAEYLLSGGNDQVVLCERGIRSYDPLMRNVLDLGTVALMKELTHLPVIVDPSHATGRRSLVPAMARAAIATGADGLIIEVHPQPERALSDADQQLSHDDFEDLMSSVRVTGVIQSPRSRPAAAV